MKIMKRHFFIDVIYFAIVTPVGLMFRLTGKPLLDFGRKRHLCRWWEIKSSDGRQFYRRPF